MRDPNVGKLIVPIVPDEGQTFGMPGLYNQFGIYSRVGQLYEPVDAGSMTMYRESTQRADLPGRDQRSRQHVQLHRRRHGVQHARRQYDPVLTSTIRCSVSSVSAI